MAFPGDAPKEIKELRGGKKKKSKADRIEDQKLGITAAVFAKTYILRNKQSLRKVVLSMT